MASTKINQKAPKHNITIHQTSYNLRFLQAGDRGRWLENMNDTVRILASWSSGKDSAWMLYRLQGFEDTQVIGLFTTVNRLYQRVAMHAVPSQLLHAQAEALGLPLEVIEIPHPCTNEQYGAVMAKFLSEAEAEGVEAIAFGDLFLEDVRRYREEQMRSTGILPIFPLWGTSTSRLAYELVEHGFRMFVTCIDPRLVPRELAGREYDRDFLKELPEGVDPCGENGEFHTFVFDGPIFTEPLHVETGRIVERDGFVFANIVKQEPESESGQPADAPACLQRAERASSSG